MDFLRNAAEQAGEKYAAQQFLGNLGNNNSSSNSNNNDNSNNNNNNNNSNSNNNESSSNSNSGSNSNSNSAYKSDYIDSGISYAEKEFNIQANASRDQKMAGYVRNEINQYTHKGGNSNNN